MDEERLIVALEARIRDFEKNMIKAEKRGTNSYNALRRGSKVTTSAMERDMLTSTKRINQALASTSTRIGSFGKAFAATAIAAGMAAITKASTDAVRSLAELGRQAERSGVSVTAFQELKFVGEQNRIEVDALIDGLKELQLRADEFIVTGQGPAAEAFRRLGYGASDLKRRLEEPEELFADIIGRMEDLDSAAQIRVADEVFGGTAGERFVELIDQGERGIRQLTARANELGIVIDEEAVERAAELDRKFAEVQARVATISKTIVVNLAGALEEAFSFDVDDIFGSAERAIAMMGEANYRALKDAAAVTEDQKAGVEDLVDTYEELYRAINRATGPDGIRLMDVADLDEAHELAAILQEIEAEMRAFQNGATSAGDFEGAVAELVEEAEELVQGLSDVDAQRFGNVIGAIGGIAEALRTAAQNAAALRENLPEGDTETAVDYGPRNGRPNNRPPNPYAPKTSLRPRLPSVDASFGVPGATTGGGSQTLDGFRKEIQETRADIAALEQEALALASVAESGRNVGDAMDYAAKKAELLHEAQMAGIEITPELVAQIEALAAEYVDAANSVDTIRDSMQEAENLQEEFRSAAQDAFADFITGAASAEEAISRLIARLADLALEAALSGLFGGLFGSIGGGLFGGARGGGGGVMAAVLHDGGIAGRDGYRRGRAVSPSVFAGAPRYHNGGTAGLRPNEVPAILEKGERVIPNGARATGDGPNIEFRVVNNRGDDTSVEQRRERGPDGRDVLIAEVNSAIRGGKMDGSLGSRYGASRKVKSR
ncbi:hypothetical protein [Roseovarius indicus]|uniref:Tail tape measure protein n=1 Tax=Roseovarius indicus TaxID=540747 RepID=A0A5P3AJK3_9RHOB|nr:hypothetical protein [Roseovarius indicus]QEW28904.1 hypothetical protein RIdsm_04745 [Roseovarius indicus]SFD82826.1 hypothetical protein SAMN04488031_102757 [Roseovarius indicus]